MSDDNDLPEPEVLPAVIRSRKGTFVKGTPSPNPKGGALHRRALRNELLDADSGDGGSRYVKHLIDDMEHDNPAIRRMASKEFADRVYGPPVAMEIPPSALEDEQLKDFVLQLIRSNPELMKLALGSAKDDDK